MVEDAHRSVLSTVGKNLGNAKSPCVPTRASVAAIYKTSVLFCFDRDLLRCPGHENYGSQRRVVAGRNYVLLRGLACSSRLSTACRHVALTTVLADVNTQEDSQRSELPRLAARRRSGGKCSMIRRCCLEMRQASQSQCRTDAFQATIARLTRNTSINETDGGVMLFI